MKKHLAKISALAGLITALVLAAVIVGQPGPTQAVAHAWSEVSFTAAAAEIEWP